MRAMSMRDDRVQEDNGKLDARLIPSQIRLIDPREGIDEADRNRIRTANEVRIILEQSGLDLMVVNRPENAPMVCKLVDFDKHRFEEQKRRKDAERKQRENVRTVKDISFKPTTDDHDIGVKVAHIRELLPKHDVRIMMKLSKHHRLILTERFRRDLREVAQDEDFVLNRVIAMLGDLIAPARIQISDNSALANLRLK